MAKKPRVIVLRTAGTNCNVETSFAFQESGAAVDEVHIEKLFSREVSLKDYHILALPGGFSYGDDIASGRILANELRIRLGGDIQQFIKAKKLVIGICNGFQVLVKAGILPGPFEPAAKDHQKTTLTNNDSAKFEDRWTYLQVSSRSVWTEGLKDIVFVPVAHGEGKFIPMDDVVLKDLQAKGQIAFRYVKSNGERGVYPDNPNGSVDDIAGITDPTGRVLGLMPHPERHFLFEQHPFWTRLDKPQRAGDGARIFRNGVDYIKKNLL